MKKAYIILDSNNKGFTHGVVGLKEAENKLNEYKRKTNDPSRFTLFTLDEYNLLIETKDK